MTRRPPRLLRLLTMGLLAFLFGCDNNPAPYQRRQGTWHFEDQALAGVHELRVLNRRFARGDTQAFYRATPIPDADAGSFEALDEHHARDRRNVWHADTYRDSRDYFTTRRVRIRHLAGADPGSFTPLGEDYARDARRVYHEGQAFPVKNPSSFEVLAEGFARDRHEGFYLRTPIRGSQGASFRVLDAHHARDALQVFHAELDLYASPPRVVARPIAGAALDSFEPLASGYARDARRVYWAGTPIDGADPASFALLDSASTPEADARDAKRRYLRGVPVT